MPRLTRRKFFAGAAVASACAASGWLWHRQSQRTIRVGLIGCGMRGSQLASIINGTHWYNACGDIVAVCDVDLKRANEVRSKLAPRADVYQDFRKLLEREDVQAVFIAAPDHWHAALSIAALHAGKHVYCEKPMTFSVTEGHELIAAVQGSRRTFMVGTQQRSHPGFQRACEIVRNGRLGQVKRVDICVPVNRAGGPFTVQSAPSSLDWNGWLGPAPLVDFCHERFARFRFWYEYGGGTIADWGAHHIDIAHWALGLEQTGPLQIAGEGTLPHISNGFNTPHEFSVELKYRDDLTMRVRSHPSDSGILFEGERGRVYVNRRRLTGKPVEDLGRQPLPADATRFGYPRRSLFVDYNTSHILHFFDCLLTGHAPVSDVLSQHRTATACHLANIALRLQRPIRWNPVTESFADDPAATAFLSRQPRVAIDQIAAKSPQRAS